MIEVRSVGNLHTALIDGEEHRLGLWTTWEDGEMGTLSVTDQALRERLLSTNLNELPEQLSLEWGEIDATSLVKDVRVRGWFRPGLFIIGTVALEIANWKNSWSPSEYLDQFERIVRQEERADFSAQRAGKQEQLILRVFYAPEQTATVSGALKIFAALVEHFHWKCVSVLDAETQTESLTLHFDFPEEVRVPCEQYLLYFSEFLRDLGVDALTELGHEAGNVLFSVIPKDRDQALEKIKEALAVYLHFPMAQGLDSFGVGIGDFRTQQLLANIQHLRGQMALASGMLQLKEATIKQQSVTIEQQRLLLSGELLVRAVVPEAEEEKEAILGGVVAITKWEGPGFELNFAEMYRKAKQLFKKS